VRFNGSSAYALARTPAALAPASVSVVTWARSTGSGAVYAKKDSTNGGWWMYGAAFTPSSYYLKAHISPVATEAAFALLSGNWSISGWQHFAQTYDAATGVHRIYRNGAFVDERTVTAAPLNAGSSSQPFSVGVDMCGASPCPGGFMTGDLDDMAIYSRALTGSEIATLAGNGQMTSVGLLARWKFEAIGTTVPDVSGNGNDLTLYGGATTVSTCH
jgi:hypothetical protein